MCGLTSAEQRGRISSLDLMSNAAQHTISPPCGKGILLAHLQLGCPSGHPSPFPCQDALQRGGLQHIPVHKVVPPHVQDLWNFLLLNFRRFLLSHFFSLSRSPDGSTTLWPVSHSSQFCVVSKLTECTLNLFIQVINEDIKQGWTQQ